MSSSRARRRRKLATSTTNRVEGKGFYWKQDNGAETLEFYPSAAYSNFVELSRLGGELGFCAPSDYIKINEDRYIYTRTECEFSGTFTAYVMDLNRIEQVGMRLGFDANDALEYYVFRGKGEWLGQLAQFEKFGDESGSPVPAAAAGQTPAKGARRVYRPLKTMAKMTTAEVDAACAKNTTAFAGAHHRARARAWPAISDRTPTGWPARRSRFATTTRRRWNTAFDDAETLNWRKEGDTSWTKARYQGWESSPGVILFGHLLEGKPNHDGHAIVADFDQGLVTCFNGYLNTPYFANEAGVKTLFGVIEMEGLIPPKYNRHEFTDEMVGRAVSQNYAPGLTSMHLYSTPHSLSWIIFTDTDAGGLEWSGPAAYVKIRDGLYFMYWLEEACNGTLGTILVNLHTMRDVGVGYNCGENGLSMSAVGAHERLAGQFDIRRFYQVKTSGRCGMTKDDNSSSTRRSFLKRGALLAAPLAARGARRGDGGRRAEGAPREAGERGRDPRAASDLAAADQHASARRALPLRSSLIPKAPRSTNPCAASRRITPGSRTRSSSPRTARALPGGSIAPWKSKPRSRRTARWRGWRTRKAAASSAGRSAAC